jgi:hypothetical protein
MKKLFVHLLVINVFFFGYFSVVWIFGVEFGALCKLHKRISPRTLYGGREI